MYQIKVLTLVKRFFAEMVGAIKETVKNKSDTKVEKQIKKKYPHECVACNETFQYNCLLKYHIRSKHFKLVSFAPCADTQEVNQVWYEKVGTTNNIVEMQKVSENELVIHTLEDGTNVQPTEIKREVIDLRKQYPICSGGHSKKRSMVKKKLIECRVCQKKFGERQISKHFVDCHAELVTKKCETCGSQFKRTLDCAKHICLKSGIK